MNDSIAKTFANAPSARSDDTRIGVFATKFLTIRRRGNA